MPLSIDLKPGEKLFINGAVIANGDSRATLHVLNGAALLRERDILAEERADTPCKRLYFTIQSMYMDPDHHADYLPLFIAFGQAIREAANSARPLLAELEGQVAAGQFYPALKNARKLIDLEEELLRHAP